MEEVQEHELPRQEEKHDLFEGDDEVMEDEPNEDVPTSGQVGKISTAEPTKLTIKTKTNPILGSSIRRNEASSVYPTPSFPEHGRIQLNKQEKELLGSSSSLEVRKSHFRGDDVMPAQLATSLTIALVPAAFTFYRVYFANGGPTWLSFHPMMMTVSLFTMLGAMFCQRLGGENSITLVGSLSFASVLSLLVGVYAVWSAKEMYGKPHFLSMHSHFGGMTIFFILSYALAAYWVYNPMQGTERKDLKWQKRLITWGKVSAGFALTSMSVGIFEIERSWAMMAIWMGSLLMVVPYLILDWYKEK